MDNSLIILSWSAIIIGFTHTILGPDHYLPFIVIAKAKNWSLKKTLTTTAICGIGHVLSSVILGIIGIMLGAALLKLELIESFRGDIAAWLLFTFGFTYFIWAVHKLTKGHQHQHLEKETNLTPWVLFIIFVFGPCEALIPLLMYPASQLSLLSTFIIAILFSVTTILTMMTIITLTYKGLAKFKFNKLEPYSHVMASVIILLSAGAIIFLGL
jgi:nickel/cobalt transporter (NicO) family protein